MWSCKIWHKWIPNAVQLKRIPMHKECKIWRILLYLPRRFGGEICWPDIITHKGHCDCFGFRDNCSKSCQFGEQSCAKLYCLISKSSSSREIHGFIFAWNIIYALFSLSLDSFTLGCLGIKPRDVTCTSKFYYSSWAASTYHAILHKVSFLAMR